MLHKLILLFSLFCLSFYLNAGNYKKEMSSMKPSQARKFKPEVTIKKANYHLNGRKLIYTAILENNTRKWLKKMSLRVHLLDNNSGVLSSGKKEIVDEFLHPGAERAVMISLPDKQSVMAIDAVSSFEISSIKTGYPNIEIINEQLVKIPTGYKLNGVVNNRSGAEMRGLTIQGVLLDKNGSVLSENQYNFNATLRPNSKTKFSIYYDKKNVLGTPMLYKFFPGKIPL